MLIKCLINHDYRQNPIAAEQHGVDKYLGWETLLNKRSTTWRQLADSEKSNVSAANILQLLQQHPTLMKRPILTLASQVVLGFSEQHTLSYV